MTTNLRKQSTWLMKSVASFLPWVFSIYIFYWLDYQIWTDETPHRGKLSVIIMATGMILSLLLWTYFKQKKK
jgi:hypothetical protein|tara:strand:- start:333 stop:548 length:216 start_codon:yes stop_codon:yes gene_type:complete